MTVFDLPKRVVRHNRDEMTEGDGRAIAHPPAMERHKAVR